ncbi:hypothetical protein ACJJTC_012854 [Scirpophaga incertulas]
MCPGGMASGRPWGAGQRQDPGRVAAWAPARNGLHFGDADRESNSEECGEDLEQELLHLCLNNYKSRVDAELDAMLRAGITAPTESHLWSTDHSSTGESPSMLMKGRRLRTHLDLLKPDRHNKVLKSQIRQVEAGGLDRKLEVGSDVWYRQYLKGEKWQPGSVSHSLGSTDYSIIDKNGNLIHRHIYQLRRRSRKSLACTVSSKLNDSNLGEPKSPQTMHTQSPQSSKMVFSPAPEQTPLVRSVAKREKEDKDCFLTPEKEVSQPVDTVPNTSTSTPAPTQPRPIRKCRLVNVPRYKF